MWSYYCHVITSIINYIVVALPVLYFYDASIPNSPEYVAQATFMAISLIAGYSQFLNMSEGFSDLAGYTSRIANMLETLKELETKQFFREKSASWVSSTNRLLIFFSTKEDTSTMGTITEGDCVKFDDVKVITPLGNILIDSTSSFAVLTRKELSFTVYPGSSLLIMGPSGSGKSSILRILNGLWPLYGGSITKPTIANDSHTMLYLPQAPYLFKGTLKEQVVYPSMITCWILMWFVPLLIKLTYGQFDKQWNKSHTLTASVETVPQEITTEDYGIVSIEESEIVTLINMVGLSYLLDNFSLREVQNWNIILSPGEQQLLSFTRLLYHKPR